MNAILKRLLIIASFLALAGQAHAGFTGNSVGVNFEAMTLGEVRASRTVTVGSGTEISGLYSGQFNFDLSDNNIQISNFVCCQFNGAGNFNGFRIFDAANNLANIISVSINAAGTQYSGFDASRISFNANEILIDMRDLIISSGRTLSLDVSFANQVPEPETTALLAVALLALGVSRRRAIR